MIQPHDHAVFDHRERNRGTELHIYVVKDVLFVKFIIYSPLWAGALFFLAFLKARRRIWTAVL